MWMVAADGIPTRKAHKENIILLNPASRRDIMVRCNTLPDRKLYLVSSKSDTYSHNHVWWVGPILEIIVEDRPLIFDEHSGQALDLTKDEVQSRFVLPDERRPCYLKDLSQASSTPVVASEPCPLVLAPRDDESVAYHFRMTFKGDTDAVNGVPFGKTMEGTRRTYSNMPAAIERSTDWFDHLVSHSMPLDMVQEWHIRNFGHPFHLHTYPFQIVGSKRNQAGSTWFSGDYQGFRMNEFYDVVGSLHRPEQVAQMYSNNGGDLVVRIHPTDYCGVIVYHCHIPGHEDNGMMSIAKALCPAAKRAWTKLKAVTRLGRAWRAKGGCSNCPAQLEQPEETEPPKTDDREEVEEPPRKKQRHH
jgi:hypothetical protein